MQLFCIMALKKDIRFSLDILFKEKEVFKK